MSAIVETTRRDRLDQIVRTHNPDGSERQCRIINMYHPGTAKWIQNHLFWASHEGLGVVITTPSEQEKADYVAKGIKRLEQQFGVNAQQGAE